MELQQLRLFLAAADSGSFTRGAKRVFVSQPALSASISKLETEMGAKLFTRHKRSVELTPAGRTLYKRAKLIVGECSKAKDELKHHHIQRMLRLGVINTLSIAQVSPLIEQFRRQNPDLRLRVFDGTEFELEQLERENRIDISLTLLQPDKNQSRQFTYSQTLFSEAYVVAMSPDHYLSRLNSVGLNDLDGEPFIARSHCEYRRIFEEMIKKEDVSLSIAYVTNQDDRALALVAAGVGIAIVPEHHRFTGVVLSPLRDSTKLRNVGLEWGDESNTEEANAFVEFAKTARWN